MTRYVFASRTGWPIDEFLRRRNNLPGEWITVTSKSDLTPELLRPLAPRYVFFPHWSSIVPKSILDAYECVCFHMTDVPFGRGGSPLQNLIGRGIRETKLSALRMTEQLDAGPVYIKRPLELSGSAEDIFRRAASTTLDIVEWMVATEPSPTAQTGEPTVFVRRKPEQSEIPGSGTAESLYDHIRMLDAAGYPHAFVDHGGWHMEFTGASLDGSVVSAKVEFSKLSPQS
ncbi:methionyl-tRNA formyltransferase [Bradyrhizobium sp. CCBAU 53338]|uniref:methionyl-tRNA formyltransferase n=1 Tax=Bradyrhizobium sp. CCBAU 53338 TaxID=1325111 RepID=UPI00188C922B|nr:methionyl-tRNA formyltransferase [Bradyrhizobium sp. CCBAU 53338]QOZ52008.1 methionyl-tRNA formyltransferase [Bradyrhizobium sp. CCBAU 53338]